MAYIHIATSKGHSVDIVKQVEEKVGPRETIDGLLVESFGQDSDYMRHVTIWESKAHKDRYEAERLMPVFQSLGLVADVAATTDFATCEADSLYVR
jgi:hypothetical protein